MRISLLEHGLDAFGADEGMHDSCLFVTGILGLPHEHPLTLK